MKKQSVIFRRGKKVILRPMQESDLPYLAKWINDPEVTQYLQAFLPRTESYEREWLAKQSKHNDTEIVWMIETFSGRPIGNIGLHRIDWKSRFATTGTMIGERAFRGRGYGTDAKLLVLEYAFLELGLNKVCSSVYDFNQRSLRYSKRCGYVQEGHLRNHVFKAGRFHDVYLLAVFRKQWEPIWKLYQRTGRVR